MRVRMTAPRAHDVMAASWAWAPGTGGATVTGPVVRIDATTPDSFAVHRGRVKQAWVMTRASSLVWNNEGPLMTAADSQRQRDFFRTVFTPFRDADSVTRARMQQFANDLPYLLRRAGALGILVDGSKEHALLNMSGSPNRILPLPQVVIAHEAYALFDRLLQVGAPPRLAVSISNTITRDSVPQWNAVAEIRGSERPGQVVIVGAHLDSWDLGTGTTDNGTGAMCTLEAARVIARSGFKPKRTIRFVLFAGEEQGLIGSRKYAEAHAAEADSIQAVIVLDNGTGAITGQALQGRTDLEALWRAVLAPVARLDADSVVNRNKTGTDHLSFLPYGVPGFNFNQLERGYGHTHHSQSDTYAMAIAADLKQAAAVMAVSASELADLPGLIPRGGRFAPAPGEGGGFGVESREVVQPGRARGGWGAPTPRPRVEPDVVMVAPRREKHGVPPVATRDVEAEDVTVEGEGAVQIRHREVHVSDAGVRVNAHLSENAAGFRRLDSSP